MNGRTLCSDEVSLFAKKNFSEKSAGYKKKKKSPDMRGFSHKYYRVLYLSKAYIS